MGHYSSFILRLWVEPPDGVRWGIIQHVATQDKLRFQAVGDGSIAVADVIDFIRQHSVEGEISLPFVLDGPDSSVDGAERAEVDEPSTKEKG
ncbi:MAG TPA: hypothetical protein VJ183_06125 [Chloroflexia bacterium]|nr:hypothetical protein [Chloroflexia bacterium]